MKKDIQRVLIMIHACSEIQVDYQRDKGFREHPLTIMALAISSLSQWALEHMDKEEAPEDLFEDLSGSHSR